MWRWDVDAAWRWQICCECSIMLQAQASAESAPAAAAGAITQGYCVTPLTGAIAGVVRRCTHLGVNEIIASGSPW